MNLLPYCLTGFVYREATWDPALTLEELKERIHHRYFSPAAPRRFSPQGVETPGKTSVPGGRGQPSPPGRSVQVGPDLLGAEAPVRVPRESILAQQVFNRHPALREFFRPGGGA